MPKIKHEKAELEGKVGGAFGAFGWSGETPERIRLIGPIQPPRTRREPLGVVLAQDVIVPHHLDVRRRRTRFSAVCHRSFLLCPEPVTTNRASPPMIQM